MQLFVTLVQVGVKRFIRYPGGLLLSLVVDPIVLLLTVLLFTAIYRHNGSRSILAYSLTQMIWYFAATQLIWHCVFNYADRRMANRVNRGDLLQDLLRPVSIFVWELGFAVSRRLSGVVIEFIPGMLIFSLLAPPTFMSAGSLVRFLTAAGVAFLLFFIINFLVGLAGLAMQNAQFLLKAKQTVVALAAGAFIPLDFFPAGIQHVLTWLPFSYIFYWPIQFFLNRGTAPGWSGFIERECIALAWLTVLFAVAWWLWRRVVRTYMDAGG